MASEKIIIDLKRSTIACEKRTILPSQCCPKCTEKVKIKEAIIKTGRYFTNNSNPVRIL